MAPLPSDLPSAGQHLLCSVQELLAEDLDTPPGRTRARLMLRKCRRVLDDFEDVLEVHMRDIQKPPSTHDDPK